MCRSCGHFWFSRMPTISWFERLYREDFDTEGPPPASPPRIDYAPISDVLRPFVPDTEARILDVGCGYGSALQHFMSLGYHNVVGMELSDRRVSTARTLGIPIGHSSAESMLDDPVVAASAPFDAAYSWHAFEHIFDPGLAIANLAKVVKPGGHLFIAVPHADAEHLVQMAHYLPHIHSFTVPSLTKLLERFGFEVGYADDSIRVVATRKDDARVTQLPSAEALDRSLQAKFIRDFDMRNHLDPVDGEVVLRYSDYRGSHEVLEPSYGSVRLVDRQSPVVRRAVRSLARVAAASAFDRFAPERQLARLAPSVIGQAKIRRPGADAHPVVDFDYEGESVDAWFK